LAELQNFVTLRVVHLKVSGFMTPETDARTALLRHTVATVAYRGAKVLRGAPAEFADFKLNPTTRTPGEILAHIGDLYDWALAMAQGRNEWHDSPPTAWPQETERFFRTLAAFDGYLASNLPLGTPAENLFQGPVADSLMHVGQLAMMRRISGSGIRGENYAKAQIVMGQVGPNQTTPRVEFG
jgi:hypothetical protein